jgi:anti-sigma B factor antagonist
MTGPAFLPGLRSQTVRASTISFFLLFRRCVPTRDRAEPTIAHHQEAFVLSLDVHHRGDHLLLRLNGELDLGNSCAFRARLIEFSRQDLPTIVDLTELQFIDSSGLAALVAILRMPASQRPRIVLASTGGAVHRVLRTTQLDRLLPISTSIDAALAAPMAVGSVA